MKPVSVFRVLTLTVLSFAAANLATAGEAAKPALDSGSVLGDPEGPLTPEEKAEKDARQACKVDLCRAFHSKVASGDLACHVVKSWRKEQLVKLVAKVKVSWPYDGAHCFTDLSLNRAELVKAMSEPKAEIQFAKHTVKCSIASDKNGSTDFSFELAPKVTFEGGKAVKAQADWGKIEAPTLIKSALWTATAADNTVNILSGSIVDEVNTFITKRCDEVKDQWAAKQ